MTFILGDKWDSRIRVTRVQLCVIVKNAKIMLRYEGDDYGHIYWRIKA